MFVHPHNCLKIYCLACRKRPFVSNKNRALRLKFAKEHLQNNEEFWDLVIWSDETKINLFESDGAQKVWRKVNTESHVKNTLPTVKHGGGSLMIWTCMSANDVGKIYFIDGIMDKVVYNTILKQNA